MGLTTGLPRIWGSKRHLGVQDASLEWIDQRLVELSKLLDVVGLSALVVRLCSVARRNRVNNAFLFTIVRELVLDMARSSSLTDRVLTGLVLDNSSTLLFDLEKLLLAFPILREYLSRIVLLIEVDVVLILST